MPTLSELIARRDALDERIQSGVTSIKTKDKTVTYSMSDMRKGLASLDARIAKMGGAKIVRQIRIRTRKDIFQNDPGLKGSPGFFH